MSDLDTWRHLTELPIDDVRHRAAVVHDTLRRDAISTWGEEDNIRVQPPTLRGAERFAWNDSGGQSVVWYFAPDGRVLLTVFDHESDLNLFAEELADAQWRMYDGVPEDLRDIVVDHAATYESEPMRRPGEDRSIDYASAVYWYDGTTWRPADGVAQVIAEVTGAPAEPGAEFEQVGLEYLLGAYILDRPFTREAFLGASEELFGLNPSESQLAHAAAAYDAAS